MFSTLQNEVCKPCPWDSKRSCFSFLRSSMCDYLVSFIQKLKQLPVTSMMDSVLENFTVLQVCSYSLSFLFAALACDLHTLLHGHLAWVNEVPMSFRLKHQQPATTTITTITFTTTTTPSCTDCDVDGEQGGALVHWLRLRGKRHRGPTPCLQTGSVVTLDWFCRDLGLVLS